jgi:hypothetical protein
VSSKVTVGGHLNFSSFAKPDDPPQDLQPVFYGALQKVIPIRGGSKKQSKSIAPSRSLIA